jgi:hypothetical protein
MWVSTSVVVHPSCHSVISVKTVFTYPDIRAMP